MKPLQSLLRHVYRIYNTVYKDTGTSSYNPHITGVQLVAPDMLSTTEGERQQLCVTIQDNDPARERSVGIAFGLYPMGKKMIILV